MPLRYNFFPLPGQEGGQGDGRQGFPALIGKWQELRPIGMYFNLTRRAMTIIVDVPNEDAFFEALHATWLVANSYPDVSPVADVSESEQIDDKIR